MRNVDGLRQSVAAMVALENDLGQVLARISFEPGRYLEAPTVLAQLRSLAREQREALQSHLDGLADSGLPALGPAISAAFSAPAGQHHDREAPGALEAMRDLALALNHTAVGYGVLHSVAHRAFVPATAEVADKHRMSYLQAVRVVHWAIGDVVVQELNEAGQTCRCQCPLCGPGLCNCSHVHAGDEAPLDPPLDGIVVRRPRPGSSADRAGLSAGDVILAVDGQETRSYEAFLDSMRGHAPGEEARLRVRRRTGNTQEIALTR
jgi:hypothetical protein